MTLCVLLIRGVAILATRGAFRIGYKFRCGNYKLPISVGRYLAGNDQRLCNLCSTGDQSDQYNYVLVCPSLIEERSKYIRRYYRTRHNTLKMNQLFNVPNVK